MYLPAHFRESRPEVLAELVREHPLGLLCTLFAGDRLEADPLPFVLDAGPSGSPGTLRCHVARANPVWRQARADVEALVVFQGAQRYVSPAFYPSKAEHGKVVPTWNYCVVEARGRLRVVDDADWLRALVARLTDRHEATRAAPWGVGDAPAPYIASMLAAIVGIEIALTSLVGKWKLSQNRLPADRAGVVLGLDAEFATSGDPGAAVMAALVAGAGQSG